MITTPLFHKRLRPMSSPVARKNLATASKPVLAACLVSRTFMPSSAAKLCACLVPIVMLSAHTHAYAMRTTSETQLSPKPYLTAFLIEGTDDTAAGGTAGSAALQTVAGSSAATTPVATEQTPGADGLTKGAVYLEANEVETIDDKVLIARGNVEMRYNSRILRADTVRYDSSTGRTLAEGHAMSINPDGSVQFADSLEVFDETDPTTGAARTTTGFGRNVASTFTDNTKIFASEFEHVSDDVTVMRQALFTPCQLCVVDGKTRPPVWSVRADRVTQDKAHNVVIYRHAMVMIHGVPLIYFPVLWHPDPSVKRASGLLMPNIDISEKKGFTYSQPYLWVISPYQSLIVEPRFNTKVNPFLNLTWSRNFYSGLMTVRLGYGHDRYFDSDGHKYSQAYDFGGTTPRLLPGDGKANDIGYVLASGAFKISDNWRWSFTAEHVEDNGGANLFDRYKVPKAFQVRGDFTAPSRQLINQINLYRQSEQLYLSFSALSFQSLKLTGYDYLDPYLGAGTSQQIFRPLAVKDDLLPKIAPMLEMHYNPEDRILGGRLSLDVSAVAIFRNAYPYANGSSDERFAPAATVAAAYADRTGFDTKRASAEINWRRDFTTPQGIRLAPFLSARHDSYTVSQLNTSGLSADVSRDNTTVGLDVAYPLMRRLGSNTLTLTPQLMLASSPESKPNDFLPNEDSQGIEFDATTLFKANKAPGYDLYEGGNRLSLGLNAAVASDKGASAEVLVGRAFRDKPEPIYLQRIDGVTTQTVYDPSGLAGKQSDWIVDTNFNTGKGLYGFSRTRLDSDDAHLRRGEVGLSVAQANSLATIRYIVDRTGPVIANGVLLNTHGTRYENTSVYARQFFTKRWGASARLNYDHKSGEWHQSEISLIYRDDCSWAEIVFQRDDTLYATTNSRKAVTSVTFRLNLVTFSPTGVEFNDIR